MTFNSIGPSLSAPSIRGEGAISRRLLLKQIPSGVTLLGFGLLVVGDAGCGGRGAAASASNAATILYVDQSSAIASYNGIRAGLLGVVLNAEVSGGKRAKGIVYGNKPAKDPDSAATQIVAWTTDATHPCRVLLDASGRSAQVIDHSTGNFLVFRYASATQCVMYTYSAAGDVLEEVYLAGSGSKMTASHTIPPGLVYQDSSEPRTSGTPGAFLFLSSCAALLVTDILFAAQTIPLVAITEALVATWFIAAAALNGSGVTVAQVVKYFTYSSFSALLDLVEAPANGSELDLVFYNTDPSTGVQTPAFSVQLCPYDGTYASSANGHVEQVSINGGSISGTDVYDGGGFSFYGTVTLNAENTNQATITGGGGTIDNGDSPRSMEGFAGGLAINSDNSATLYWTATDPIYGAIGGSVVRPVLS